MDEVSKRRNSTYLFNEQRATLKKFLPIFIDISNVKGDTKEAFYNLLRPLPIENIPNKSLEWLWSARTLFMTIVETPGYLVPKEETRLILLSQLGQSDPISEQLIVWAFNVRQLVKAGRLDVLSKIVHGDVSGLSDAPTWHLRT